MPDHREPKISQIHVNGHRVGLRNLDEALANVRSRNIDADDKLKRALIEEMRARKNYIPVSAEAQYQRALLREYRRFIGQPCDEDEEAGLTVKVLGMGCPNCRRLTEEVLAALTELGIGADVEHVTDVNEIGSYGVVGTPALIINKQVKSVGRIPRREQIKKWLKEGTENCSR